MFTSAPQDPTHSDSSWTREMGYMSHTWQFVLLWSAKHPVMTAFDSWLEIHAILKPQRAADK
eukprot:2781919-Amphidinium_carterae.2